MDPHSGLILNQYKSLLPALGRLREIVTEKIGKSISEMKLSVDGISSRIKTEKSLTGKLDRKGYKYKDIFDITDILGVRVVTIYSDEVDRLAAKIETMFVVDWDNTIDKRKMLSDSQFGYMSLHYVCSLSAGSVPDAPGELYKIRFEIQIRTVLQHVWATVDHDNGYKSDVEIPREYFRRFNRLAGLLELADEEFKNIRIGLDSYRRKVKQVVASGSFDDVELNADSFSAYLKSGAFEKLNERIAAIKNMEIVETNAEPFLKVFVDMGMRTLGEIEEMRKENEEAAFQLALRQFNETDLDIVASIVGIQNVLTIAILKKGGGEEGILKMLNTALGERKSNARYAKSMMSFAAKMGIIKDKA